MAHSRTKRGKPPAEEMRSRISKDVQPRTSSPVPHISVPLFGTSPPVSNKKYARSSRVSDHGRGRDPRPRLDAQAHSRPHSRHHHHSRQPKTLPNPPLPPRVKIQLVSLDPRYVDFEVRINPDFLVEKLEDRIRRLYREKHNRWIESTAHFKYYAQDATELQPTDRITADSSRIWYHMSKTPDEIGRWKFTHFRDMMHGRLDYADELIKAIEGGATVRELRRLIADHLAIEDPYRVVLIARDGTRRGLLHGDCWESQRRDYVYHPDGSYLKNGMTLRSLRRYLETRLFSNVCHPQRDKTEYCPQSRSTFTTIDGQRLGLETRVCWGATYKYELLDDAAETFSSEEAWLLPTTETCIVCVEDKKISDLPVKVTKGCKHDATVCKDCLKTWLSTGLETGAWDKLKCPECPELLEYRDIQRYASPATFARYDVLTARAAVQKMPNFGWCLSTKCESGQIHDPECAKFQCMACRSSHCVTHNVAWHDGETCEEYDARNQQRKKDEKASEKIIKKTSRNCPRCKRDVHKYVGCNHITCTCGHEWCYICLESFVRNSLNYPICNHKNGCPEFDMFAEIFNDPNRRRPPLRQNHARHRTPPGPNLTRMENGANTENPNQDPTPAATVAATAATVAGENPGQQHWAPPPLRGVGLPRRPLNRS
ncbi:hypothetical protein B0T17DRAFT_509660 [Bombardia bombarda]|uniref:RBR-type E3 ubiquitin transferase n=1 Tax=Bombardia bombarda TaxID=252184 RepID=A0AA39WME8_9PEZI|nr:hypothetical protein B0T17DRAFT_509660 [Bombardia bombarda]